MPSSAKPPILLRRFETPIGPMVGGATEDGVCLCEFADRGGEERIVARLQERHGSEATWEDSGDADRRAAARSRRAQESPDTSSLQASRLEALEGQLHEYFAGTRKEFDLPLDLAGSPWQEKVWSALLQIPYGTTVSYGELAARLGNPGGSRAVGRANGDNSVAIVIPCHRVVQADGGLRGYGGGLHRKRWLLDLEAGVQQLSL
jgi:AraC family transcriptional regulator of adaptative response/methylated-DNA-[protein]-cysteine methyltransferase